MKNIYYIWYYSNDPNRNFVLSAKNKIDYIIEAMNSLSYKVNIISASGGKNKVSNIKKKKKKN